MMLARAQPVIAPAQRRNAHRIGSSANLPAIRPSLICRFKEGDDVEEQLQKQRVQQLQKELKEATDDFKASLQQQAAPQQTPLPESSGVDSKVKTNWLTPAFTRRREVFVGRAAMIGFFAACFWEYYLPNHPNIIQQVSGFTGISGETVYSAILFLFVYNLLGALAPASPTLKDKNLQDVAKRPDGPPQNLVNPLDVKRFWGFSTWGFSKINELFNGRMAMLGFAAAIFQQMRIGGIAGPGPLAQIAYFTNVPADDSFYGSAGTYLFAFTLVAAGISFLTGVQATSQEEDEIY